MPEGLIQSFAKQSGKTKEEVERLWNDTQKIIKKEYPDKKEDDFYRLVVGVLKRRLGITEEDGEVAAAPAGDAVITTTSMGGDSALYRTKVMNTVARFGDFKDMDDWGRTTSDIKRKKKKKRNESVQLAIEYINKKLDEVDSPEMQRFVKDYQKAQMDLATKTANDMRKRAGNKLFAGPQKRKNIAAAKVLQQKVKEIKSIGRLMSADDVIASELK
jgi:hypothetical protein